MNLLPHKSWNVWSAKNKEKVRKEEEKYKGVEEKEKQRIARAEQEARYNLLRSKAKKRKEKEKGEEDDEEDDGEGQQRKRARPGIGDETTESVNPLAVGVVPSTLPSEHLNLFANFVEKNSSRPLGGNPEYEEEKRAQELKQKQRETTYLAQSSAEAKKGDSKPWYQKKADTKTIYAGLTQVQQE